MYIYHFVKNWSVIICQLYWCHKNPDQRNDLSLAVQLQKHNPGVLNIGAKSIQSHMSFIPALKVFWQKMKGAVKILNYTIKSHFFLVNIQ